MAARSPSANWPAAARLAERPVHSGGTVQRGQLHRLGCLGPHPRGTRHGGLGQPQLGAVADRQELASAWVRGFGVRFSAPGGAGG